MPGEPAWVGYEYRSGDVRRIRHGVRIRRPVPDRHPDCPQATDDGIVEFLPLAFGVTGLATSRTLGRVAACVVSALALPTAADSLAVGLGARHYVAATIGDWLGGRAADASASQPLGPTDRDDTTRDDD